MEKSLLIELMPTKLNDTEYCGMSYSQQAIYDNATHEYPPKLNMSNNELNEWVLDFMDKIKKNNNIRINKIIYYRITDRNHTLIIRDDAWFDTHFNTINKIWNYVLFLRNNHDVATEFKHYIESLSTKRNDKIMLKLEELYKKHHFMEVDEMNYE